VTQDVEPTPREPRDLSTNLDELTEGMNGYLEYLGLPTDSVIVETDQRKQAINNLPYVVSELDADQKRAATYLSKFVAACAMGLFDAALNYLWDETVRNLREKVARFDLNYFYDSVITDPDRRSKFKDASDLVDLEDWRLITGCKETGIIGEVGFKHLDYIRDMRNHASAAHPNHNEVTGLQLAAWLQTCVREVLGKEPEGAAFEVRRLLKSLREELLSESEVPHIGLAVERLPEELSRSLMRAAFGMYTDTNLSAQARGNIRLVAGEIWRSCGEEARHEAGLKHATLSANGEASRVRLAREFMEIVGGLPYLPPDTLSLEISRALDALLSAHYGTNNFYNESAPARILQSLVPPNGVVPKAVVRKYVAALVLCAIGNGYGISWSAEPIYKELIGRWQDEHVFVFATCVRETEVESRLRHTSCAANYQEIARKLEPQVVRPQLKSLLTFLADFPTNSLEKVTLDSRFQEMLATARPRR
jgi:hypothetical protein